MNNLYPGPKATHPDRLFRAVKEHLHIKTYAVLADSLRVTESTLSYVRSGTYELSSDLILRVHDLTGWGIDRIRWLAGISKNLLGEQL